MNRTHKGSLKAGVKCPFCGSDDTVVMAVILGCPFEADILCRNCKRIFGYSYHEKSIQYYAWIMMSMR